MKLVLFLVLHLLIAPSSSALSKKVIYKPLKNKKIIEKVNSSVASELWFELDPNGRFDNTRQVIYDHTIVALYLDSQNIVQAMDINTHVYEPYFNFDPEFGDIIDLETSCTTQITVTKKQTKDNGTSCDLHTDL